MARSPIEVSGCEVDLRPAPIEPTWILDGNPQAQSRLLWTSDDGTADTLIWSCSEGEFIWLYDCDETILILEGSIVLEDPDLPAKRLVQAM